MKFSSVEHEVIFNKLIGKMNGSEKNVAINQEERATVNASDYFGEISRYINIMDRNRENFAHRPIFSHRKILGPFIVFGKKVVRKFLKWYIDPIALQQTAFNNAVTPAIGRLTELTTHIQEQTRQHGMKLELLNNQIKGLIDIQSTFDEKAKNFDRMHEMYSNSLKLYAEKIDSVTDVNKALADKFTEFEDKFKKFEDALEINLLKENSVFEKRTYSQSGEDSILCYILYVLGIPFESVTYVDLGAHHAKEMSNTYFFYKMGGHGILVEANPQLIPELKFYRNRDIVLNRCIDVESGKIVDFFIFNGNGLSTPSYETATKYMEINPDLKIVDKIQVETISYNDLVEHYLGQPPTILSIDIEGNDFEILRSIDFEKYRPMLIVAEMISYDTRLNHRSKNAEIKAFLESQGYDEYAFTGINSIFLDKKIMA